MDISAKIENRLRESVSDVSGRIIAGVSGGADSVALLLALRSVEADFMAVHCNFCLRGKESDRDEAFVRKLCSVHRVALRVERFDTRGYMERERVSLEMACRDLRYSLFRRILSEYPGGRIATGHHRDDNIETMLINMLRGSGIEGMRGMVADTGEILRPLLGFSREELKLYVREKGENFVTDSSNLTSEPLRNFLRRDVIPLLETRVAGVAARLERTRSMLERAARVYERANKRWDTDILHREDLQEAPDVATAIHEYLRNKCSGVHIEEEMIRAYQNGVTESRRWNFSNGTIALHRGDFYFLPAGMEMDCECEVVESEFSPSSGEASVYLPHSSSAYEWTDVRPGMEMRPLGMGGKRKKVADILSEAGIPTPARCKVKVLVRRNDGECVWIPYIRRSEWDKIEQNSSKIYKFRLKARPFYYNWVKKHT